MTQILPTNKYLARYRVTDSDICSKCHVVTDSVSHSLWSCKLLVPYVEKFIDFLKQTCNVQEVGLVEYIFGFRSNLALNHIFIEFKKEVFTILMKILGLRPFVSESFIRLEK